MILLHIFQAKIISSVERGGLSYFSLHPQHLMCSWHAEDQKIFVKELMMKFTCTNIKDT